MRFRKYLLVPWTAVSFYAIASMIGGASGIGAYGRLLEERKKIVENLENLQGINRELEGTMDALLYDSEAIKVRARELGYGESGERFVRIVGLSGVRYRETSPGTVKTAAPSPHVPDTTLRIMSILAGCGLFLAFFIGDMLKTGGNFNGSSATQRRPSCPDSVL